MAILQLILLSLIQTKQQIIFIEELVDYIKSSVPATEGGTVYYPGELEINTRNDNKENGIPVIEEKWNAVPAM